MSVDPLVPFWKVVAIDRYFNSDFRVANLLVSPKEI